MKELEAFAKKHRFTGKGPLCVALVVTRHATEKGLPLDPESLVTDGKGQVLGLGKSSVQSILKQHGITRILAAEGGRTSRGSIRNMRKYVEFLNNQQAQKPKLDLSRIEQFWIARVEAFFAGKPFSIRLDASVSLRTVVREVLAEAKKRQDKTTSVQYAGAVMQHLVGAKLECALGKDALAHNSFSTSDQQTGRAGDFQIGDVAIHVTTAPGEAVIERCRGNLDSGLKPVLVTLQKSVQVAEGLAENASLSERIDIFEVTQFVALNVYELGEFSADGRKRAITDIIEKYNEIINQYETDPSLRIEFRK